MGFGYALLRKYSTSDNKQPIKPVIATMVYRTLGSKIAPKR